MNIEILGARLVDPANGIDAIHDLYIADGVVAGVDNAPENFKAAESVDGRGLVLCPGLVDLQARLREPGEEHKASMKSELAAAAAGGITSICCPPDTYPPIDTPAMVQMVIQRARSIEMSRVHPVGALTHGLTGESLTNMASLADAGCIGVSNADRPIENTLVMRRAMQYASTFDMTVFLSAQDPWLRGNGCVHEGEVSTRLGLPAIPEAAESVGVARELALIETTGVRGHLAPLSSARAIDKLAEARARGVDVTAAVTAHHLHLSEYDVGIFDTSCHVIPPLRSETDRSRLRQGVAAGIVSAICSDHQPHGADAKLAPFSESAPGMSGLETLLPLTLKLVDDGVLELPQAIAAVTTNPARIARLPVGHLAVGAPADICLFDPDAPWTLEASMMRSRGRNTPFIGWTFKARTRMTLVAGRIVYRAPVESP